MTGTSGALPGPEGPVDVPGARGAADAADAPPSGRIVLLTTSRRVAPGLLSWPAWQALHHADRVLCVDPDHPQLSSLRAAGITVEQGPNSAGELVELCAGGATVVVVASGEQEPWVTEWLAELAGSGRPLPALEFLPASHDLPGARLLDLVQVMADIRAQDLWASRQTHRALAKYVVEEAYELVEAIEDGNRDELCEELGDVLLQVVFHARIAEDALGRTDGAERADGFTIDDVAAGIVAKLVHRHPHLFGEQTAETAEEVMEHWHRAKAAEKKRASVTDGVPLGQPALALAAKLASRARLAGLDVPLPTGGSEAGAGPDEHDEHRGLGYELLALAVRAQEQGVDPEAALRAAARTYRDAIRAVEERGRRPAGP